MSLIYIGIDPGVETGVAIWSKGGKKFYYIETIKIHQAMDILKRYKLDADFDFMVIVEDARKRGNGGKLSAAKAQGAGSVKRDCKIWEDFLTDKKIPFILKAPSRTTTKMTQAQFKKLTGWKNATNSHGRDAAMLVYGY